ncbi:MAG TPA: SRPBCC domain-containing protein [Streptosporangiaceae bacterium]
MTATHAVEVSVHVAATPEDVFRYFTDPARYVQWMGSEATLEPVPGGTYRVRMPDGFRAAGTFLQIDSPHRLAFTWGFADADAAQRSKHEQAEESSGNPMPAGSTRVTVTLDAADGGTRLTLRHDDLPNDELRDGHRVAWQTYLPRLVIRAAGGDPGPDPHS